MYPYKEKLRKLIDHRDPRKKIKEGSFLDRSEIVPEGNLVEESFFFFFLQIWGFPFSLRSQHSSDLAGVSKYNRR